MPVTAFVISSPAVVFMVPLRAAGPLASTVIPALAAMASSVASSSGFLPELWSGDGWSTGSPPELLPDDEWSLGRPPELLSDDRQSPGHQPESLSCAG